MLIECQSASTFFQLYIEKRKRCKMSLCETRTGFEPDPDWCPSVGFSLLLTAVGGRTVPQSQSCADSAPFPSLWL